MKPPLVFFSRLLNLTFPEQIDGHPFDAVIESIPVAGRDIIRGGFDQGVTQDKIDLLTIDANTTLGGDQSFTLLAAVNAAFTGVAGQLRYFQAQGSTFIEGDVNGDSSADIQVHIAGLYTMTGTDFIA